MAKIYPPLNVIKNFKVKPTEGELKLLEFLSENYNDEYEVFFQPFLNEARPDVVVMRKGGGVMIIEVKDWDLSNYKSTPTGTWIVKANGSEMRYTPIRQVASYKDKLYSLNSWKLFERRVLGDERSRSVNWGIVHCAVFFHNSTEAQAKALCYPQDITERNQKFLRYIDLLGDDSLTKDRFDKILRKNYISEHSRYFSDEVYEELFQLFSPDFHTIEQGIEYRLTQAQQELTKSVAGAHKRIKGVAGSGKSFVLARRAVNAHKRTGNDVLILTYNITLKNYLHDRMSEVRENFDWRYFHIQNYHQFFNKMLGQCNMTVMDVARRKWPKLFAHMSEDDEEKSNGVMLSDAQLDAIYSDGSVFEGFQDQIRKYDAIFIDEAQDYEESWVRIINRFAANKDAEIVAFADEKQNVYDRKLDANKFPVIPIATGRWDTTLNTSYRLNKGVAELAVEFQKAFFNKKYVIDDKISVPEQMEFVFDRAHIEYHLLPAQMDQKTGLENLAKYIRDVMHAYRLHANDVTVLSSGVDFVRELSDVYARQTMESVNTMCETREEYKKVGGDAMRIKDIRQFKKQNFWQNHGSVSFSSIHSFKGLESPATILVLGNGSLVGDEEHKDINLMPTLKELTYVGLTRTRNFLYVVNFGDMTYDGFFRSDVVRHLGDGISTAIEGSAA